MPACRIRMGPRPGAVQGSVSVGHASGSVSASGASARPGAMAGAAAVTGIGRLVLPRIGPRPGQATIVGIARNAGVQSTGGFDSGMTYTATHDWPTGMGWTAGALSTIRTNINNLLASAGNGADATHHVRHRPTAGAVYPIDADLRLDGRAHVTFEFGGTEIATSPWGHTGGATISTTGVSGTSARQSLFNGGTGAAMRFEDIRWHAGTLKGSAVNLASSTAASQATESQHGIGSFGGHDGLVDHMIFTDFAGDNVYLCESLGTNGVQSGVNSDNWEFRYSRFLQCARQGVAPGQGADNVWFHHCYFADPAYAYIDVEGNRSYQLNSNFTIEDCVFAGRWAWMSTGGPEGQGLAIPAVFFTNIQNGAYFSGYMRFRNNLIAGIEASPFYAVTTRQILATKPWGDFEFRGEVTVTGNVKTSAEKAGPIMSIRRRGGTDPFVVQNNANFHTGSGSWLDVLNSNVAATTSGLT